MWTLAFAQKNIVPTYKYGMSTKELGEMNIFHFRAVKSQYHCLSNYPISDNQ